jgi:hypothetical protein
MATKISYAVAVITGLGMIFLGARFFYAPEAATAAFGIHLNGSGDYSFHYTKGIRDIFSGLLFVCFCTDESEKGLRGDLTSRNNNSGSRYAYCPEQALYQHYAGGVPYYRHHDLLHIRDNFTGN